MATSAGTEMAPTGLPMFLNRPGAHETDNKIYLQTFQPLRPCYTRRRNRLNFVILSTPLPFEPGAQQSDALVTGTGLIRESCIYSIELFIRKLTGALSEFTAAPVALQINLSRKIDAQSREQHRRNSVARPGINQRVALSVAVKHRSDMRSIQVSIAKISTVTTIDN